jgi:hypothetical protein
MFQRRDGSFFVREFDTWLENQRLGQGDFHSEKGNIRRVTHVHRARCRSLTDEEARQWIIERFIPEFWRERFSSV